MISLEDFQKLDIRIGVVEKAEPIEGSESLLLLKIRLDKEERQIVSGLADFYSPEQLLGRQIVLLANLEPRKFFGIESQGMLLAVDDNKTVALLTPDKKVAPGSQVR